MIRLRFLPVNQAWAFLFGDVATASLLQMDGHTLFPTRQDAIGAARVMGLTVKTDGAVSIFGHSEEAPSLPNS